MSIRDIIEHSITKNPLAMKEALEEEMRNRVADAIQTKFLEAKKEEDDEDENDEEDEDEDDEDE